jgi:tRNA threonylcarbamoyl adenosine modification protein YjeE
VYVFISILAIKTVQWSTVGNTFAFLCNVVYYTSTLMINVYSSHTPQDTHRIAQECITALMGRDNVQKGATIITLQGDLGAGKTVFVKGVAEVLGVLETVTSPTYVLQKTYPIDKRGVPWKRLVHIDAYRLQDAKELPTIGWDTYSSDSENLIMIEWPEQMGNAIHAQALTVRIAYSTETSREISITQEGGVMM